jgi:hypothetical protein
MRFARAHAARMEPGPHRNRVNFLRRPEVETLAETCEAIADGADEIDLVISPPHRRRPAAVTAMVEACPCPNLSCSNHP